MDPATTTCSPSLAARVGNECSEREIAELVAYGRNAGVRLFVLLLERRWFSTSSRWLEEVGGPRAVPP